MYMRFDSLSIEFRTHSLLIRVMLTLMKMIRTEFRPSPTFGKMSLNRVTSGWQIEYPGTVAKTAKNETVFGNIFPDETAPVNTLYRPQSARQHIQHQPLLRTKAQKPLVGRPSNRTQIEPLRHRVAHLGDAAA